MYFVFAWHEGCQLGGAHDLVGMFVAKEDAFERASKVLSDPRFEVQVVDSRMRVIFESDNGPVVIRTLEEVRLQ